jgi:hypothetical protein
MSEMDKFYFDHLAEALAYRRSEQSAIDVRLGKIRRAELDRAAGHSPKCGILNCAPCCPSPRPFLSATPGARRSKKKA